MLNNMKKIKILTVAFFIFIGGVSDVIAAYVIGTDDNIDTGDNKIQSITSTMKTFEYKDEITLRKQAPSAVLADDASAFVFSGNEQSNPEWVWDKSSSQQKKNIGEASDSKKKMSYEEYFCVDRRLMEIKSNIDNEINIANENEPEMINFYLSNDQSPTEKKSITSIQNNTSEKERLILKGINEEFNQSVYEADIEINEMYNQPIYEDVFDWAGSRRTSNSSLTSLLDDSAESIDHASATLLLEQQWDIFNNEVYEELEKKINDFDAFDLSSTPIDGDATATNSTSSDGDATATNSTSSDGDATGASSTPSDGDARGASSTPIDGDATATNSTSSDGDTTGLSSSMSDGHADDPDEGGTTVIADAEPEEVETIITESEELAGSRLAPETLDLFTPQPQAGIYIANLSAANTMFAHRMHDRIGEPTFPTTFGDLDDGIQPAMWLRVVGGRNTMQVRNGQLETSTRMELVHGGAEVVNWHFNGNDGLHLGVIFGAGKSHSHSHVADSALLAKGSVEGYSTGVYGTWHRHDNTHQGLYVDGSLSYNWFSNQVDTPMSAAKGIAGNAQTYRSRGFIGSLESGYTWNIFSGERVDAFLQPQMQITWLGVKAHIDGDNNGDPLEMLGNDHVQTRLGTRLFLRGYASRDIGKQRMFQPYMEVNWLHNNQAYGVRLNHETYYQDGTHNIGEIRIGNEGQINQHLALWGNVAQQVGDDGFHETVGTLGIKVNF